MSLLDRYFFGRTAVTLFKVLLTLVSIYVVFDLLTRRSAAIVENDVPWTIVLIYYACEVLLALYQFQLAALAMLIAGLLVLGGAAQNNEFTAILAGGLSLRRMVAAPVLVAAMLAAVVFVIQETVGVTAAARADEIAERYFAQNPEDKRGGISWSHLEEGWKCHILKFNRIALSGENVLLLSHDSELVQRIEARRIYWDSQREAWMIEDGIWSTFYPDEGMAGVHERITQREAPLRESPDDLFAIDKNPAAQPASELAGNIRRARERGMPVHRLEVDWHGKFAKPVLPFVMIWLAVPFALRVRRGGLAVGFGLSIAIALVYLLLFGFMQGLGYLGRLTPMSAAWLANLLFLGVGLVLFYRTPT